MGRAYVKYGKHPKRHEVTIELVEVRTGTAAQDGNLEVVVSVKTNASESEMPKSIALRSWEPLTVVIED